MSQVLIVIATAMVTFLLGRLTTWPTIRRLRAQLDEANRRSQRDPLTGLYNRAGLTAAYTARQHTGQQVLLALLDVDRLKSVNDRYGHEAGDALLTAVGTRLAEAADRYHGVAARLAGDEFVILLPVTDAVHRHVDAIVSLVNVPVTATVDAAAATITPSVSVGASWGEPTDPLSDRLRRADIAMYHAKRRGGTAYYRPGMAMPASPRRPGRRLRDLPPHDTTPGNTTSGDGS